MALAVPGLPTRVITGAVALQETARCLFVLPMALSGLINTRIKEGKTDADISIAFSQFHVKDQLLWSRVKHIWIVIQGTSKYKHVGCEVKFLGSLAGVLILGQS